MSPPTAGPGPGVDSTLPGVVRPACVLLLDDPGDFRRRWGAMDPRPQPAPAPRAPGVPRAPASCPRVGGAFRGIQWWPSNPEIRTEVVTQFTNARGQSFQTVDYSQPVTFSFPACSSGGGTYGGPV